MNPRTRNLAVAGGAVLVILFLLVRGQAVSGGPATPRSASPTALVAATIGPTPATTTLATGVFEASPAGAASRGMDTYAVDISWLKGFPPDAAPGDVFDIWVAWDRSVVKRPNMQLLLEGVVLEKVAPPVTAQGPYVAILLMTRQQSMDFLYGKEYGSLSVTRPTG